ncbi:MAG: Npt1/Npt2 family nucleotide transporter [Nostocaceae cyanobacterium]|nr:Npt1/Npt2 family nucleotide transporter [Nostocaceae cyanobacterium]
MELTNNFLTRNRSIWQQILQSINLRPEESKRTFLMFVIYTIISVGIRWAERSTDAELVSNFGAYYLPQFYIGSAVMGILVVFVYSWLQRNFALRWVIVAIAPMMAIPLLLFHWGIQIPGQEGKTLLMLRLWLDAIYVANELNTAIAANQLFNIREIKRTYPLISSGFLVAQIFSGFSLSWLLNILSLHNLILITGVLIVFGSTILLYLSRNYPQAFPNFSQPKFKEVDYSTKRRLSRPLQQYVGLSIALFALLHIIGMLIEFQYFSQVESKFQGGNREEIARFLGLLDAIVGISALGTQWFLSSRVLERIGAFFTIAILPASMVLLPMVIAVMSLFPGLDFGQNFFWGLVIFQFWDDLLRYTFVANNGTLLFQPIPDKIRSYLQTLSDGIGTAIGALTSSVIILGSSLLGAYLAVPDSLKIWVLPILTAIIGGICLKVILIVRSRYVDLLVLSAQRGQLSVTNVDLRAFKQAVIKTLVEKNTYLDQHSQKSLYQDKLSCIDLLSHIDPKGVGEVLAPLLDQLPPLLQYKSLEAMLKQGANPAYIPTIQTLLAIPKHLLAPEVFALGLRYIWLAGANPDLRKLEQYLNFDQHSLIRGTAAALLLREGSIKQKLIATKVLGRMLNHKQERERVNGVKVLKEAVYLQALRIHIPNLLQDKSLEVRLAVLELIAATRLEEYYQALVMGLCYKSTRNITMEILVKLEDEILANVIKFATDIYQPQVARMYAWRTIGQIPSTEALNTLWMHLEASGTNNRNYILRAMLRRHQKEGIVGLVDNWHQRVVEKLIIEELCLLGEIYAAYIDFQEQESLDISQSNWQVINVSNLLQQALIELERDVKERLLLILKLVYPQEIIQAATFNLLSSSGVNIAQGLEILDTLNLRFKSVFLNILDRRSPQEKLQTLIVAGLVDSQPMSVGNRTRRLLEQHRYLSDWCLACCFHFAKVARIRLTIEQVLDNLRHPTGFVREAAIAYLQVAALNTLLKIVPQMQNDPDPLVATQVKELMNKHYANHS